MLIVVGILSLTLIAIPCAVFIVIKIIEHDYRDRIAYRWVVSELRRRATRLASLETQAAKDSLEIAKLTLSNTELERYSGELKARFRQSNAAE